MQSMQKCTLLFNITASLRFEVPYPAKPLIHANFSAIDFFFTLPLRFIVSE